MAYIFYSSHVRKAKRDAHHYCVIVFGPIAKLLERHTTITTLPLDWRQLLWLPAAQIPRFKVAGYRFTYIRCASAQGTIPCEAVAECRCTSAHMVTIVTKKCLFSVSCRYDVAVFDVDSWCIASVFCGLKKIDHSVNMRNIRSDFAKTKNTSFIDDAYWHRSALRFPKDRMSISFASPLIWSHAHRSFELIDS